MSGGAPGGAGTDGARAATISFMVGGDADAFERAKPTLAILGKRWFYLGPSGTGSTVKLISNLMAGLHNLVASEAFVLGAAAGIEPETLLEVFDGTDAKSFWLTDYFAPRVRRRDFEPGFSVDLQYKDHRLASDLGRQLGVPCSSTTSRSASTRRCGRAVSAARTWWRACGSSVASPGPTSYEVRRADRLMSSTGAGRCSSAGTLEDRADLERQTRHRFLVIRRRQSRR